MRAVIAEDLALLRDGLTRLLRDNGIDVIAAVDNPSDLIAAVERKQPDIAIVDIRLPPTFRDEGLRAAIELRLSSPKTSILVVSQYVERSYAAELLADGRGGIGYLLKDRIFDVAAFVDSVRRVAAGGTALDPEVVAQLVSRRRPGGALDRLTPRAGSARADGRRKVERRPRREACAVNGRHRKAHRQYLHQARPGRILQRTSSGAGRACSSQQSGKRHLTGRKNAPRYRSLSQKRAVFM